MKVRLSWGLTGGLISGLLIAIPALTTRSIAATPGINPCPAIYYEEPHNSSRLVPSGCRPNAFTQSVNAAGGAPVSPNTNGNQLNQSGPAGNQGSSGSQLNRISPTTSEPAQPPLPETQEDAIATVIPSNGNVDVVLRNTTNAVITYEVIGQTQQRTLAGGEEVVLQSLPLPVTITTVRQDRGLVDIQAMTPTSSGRIVFSLGASAQLNSEQGAIRIQQSGQVFVN